MSSARLQEVVLDETTIAPAAPEMMEERRVAIRDLVEENSFQLPGRDGGPYRLELSLENRKLVFAISDAVSGEDVAVHVLSLTPFKRIVRDYDLIRESYYAAVRDAAADRIEAIDMGRRGVHNEGSQLLMDRLEGKIEVDFETARRLFTLVCALGESVVGRGPSL